MRGCPVLLEVNASFLVIFVCDMRDCRSISKYMMPVMAVSMNKKGPVHSFFAEGAEHVHFSAVTNMFQEETWIFAAPYPADLDMKLALITENYGVQNALIISGSYIEP
jgi:hypothetical protein